ncbi:cell wall-active antibiotics response protein LiaF [Bacillus infantis]|uniref:cell wall-active antibiotics response protein LiaF n=1 Tax=Bacillus infantis TaxID=324767 RepID=UPI001CD2F5E0|nr:cell wall-active antibiotics response protein LiaF [Bacillus infantis]MCA1039406.1 cell wall-active antibiotics response protein LiaF [Bacillus infantis]
MRYRSVNQMMFALCLLAAGVLLLLVNIGVISLEIKEFSVAIYPFVMFGYSLILLISALARNKGGKVFAGFLLIFAGLLASDRLGLLQFSFWDVWKLWPLAIVYLGFSLLIRKEHIKVHVETEFPAKKYEGAEEGEKGPDREKIIRIKKGSRHAPLANIRGFSIGDVSFKDANWSVEPMDLYNTVGDYFIDFSKAYIPQRETPISVKGWVGDVKMIIPEDVPIMVHSHINIGDIRIFDMKSEDLNRKLYFKSPGYDDAARKLNITIQLKVGSIRIDHV